MIRDCQPGPAPDCDDAVAYALAVQRDLHRELATAMRSVQGNEPAAAWTLAGLGFLYGVFHAAGPGHGKVVISTYLATHESRLVRGVALSVLSSLLQGANRLVQGFFVILADAHDLAHGQHLCSQLVG